MEGIAGGGCDDAEPVKGYSNAGRVVMGRFATDEAEAAAIAGDVLKFRVTDFDAAQSADPVPPAMAVLCRRRAQMECIRREFEAPGHSL